MQVTLHRDVTVVDNRKFLSFFCFFFFVFDFFFALEFIRVLIFASYSSRNSLSVGSSPIGTLHFRTKDKMSSRQQRHSQKVDQRKKEFKKGIDSEEQRKKREETNVTIRKSKREESLQKKRNVSSSSDKKVVDATIVQKVEYL